MFNSITGLVLTVTLTPMSVAGLMCHDLTVAAEKKSDFGATERPISAATERPGAECIVAEVRDNSVTTENIENAICTVS